MENLFKLSMLDVVESKQLKNDLDEMIELFKVLEEVKIIDETDKADNFFRADEELKSFDKEELMRNAPLAEDGFFIVPKIVG